MRDKRRPPKRPGPRRKAAATFGTADWVLVNQGGWGPYSALAMLAGIVVGLRAAAWQVARIAAALARAPRRGREGPGRDRPA